MHTSSTFQVEGYNPCPRCTFFLIHDSSTDMYRFAFFNREDNCEQKETEAIVHCTTLSEFAPYFVFLDDESRDAAATAITSLLLDSIALVISKPVHQIKVMPAQLKKIYSKTVHFLKNCAEGCFLTDIFLRKLWQLAYRIWLHVVAYKQWCLPKTLPQQMATEMVC